MKRVLIACWASVVLASCGGGSPQATDFASDKPTSEGKAVMPGENLFKQNCRVCHTPERAMTGPALKGCLARWGNDTARIKAFIKNSAKAIRDGDPRAVQVYNEWNKVSMTPMTHLSDKDIGDILTYIESSK